MSIEPLDITWEKCQQDANLIERDLTLDPFSSFSVRGMPSTLVSHWILPHESIRSLSSIGTLRAHYVRIPNPGSLFLSTDEVMMEIEKFMDEQRRKNSCAQS